MTITDSMVEAAAKASYEHWQNVPACTASKSWEERSKELPGSADFFRALSRKALTAALSVEQEPVAWVSEETLLILRHGGSGILAMTPSKSPSHRPDCIIPLFTRPSTEVDRLRAENERLREALESLVSVMEHCSVTSGVCGCGESMHNHSEFSGHTPTDYGSYVAEQAYQQARAALSQEGK